MADSPGSHAGATARAIRSHYDAGNDFFAAWLDPSMTYSAGRWGDGPAGPSDLHHAQLAKLDWHLDAARVQGGSLLDIGCGWGSLLFRAATERGVSDLTGITASPNQADWIRGHAGNLPISILAGAWQQAVLDRSFDAIVSVGAMEHFVGPGLGSDEKIRIYRDFFGFCHRHLNPGGRMSIQFIAWMDLKGRKEEEVLPLELFPESTLPCPIEVLTAADSGFHLVALENRPSDYSRTLTAWLDHLAANRDRLIAAHGKDLVIRHVRGFRRFILGFEGGTIGLFRVVLQRR